MAWPRRPDHPPADARASPPARAEPVEGAAPGIAALFQGIAEDRTHAVLDLGAASAQSLRVYSRFARWVHFADVLGETWSHQHSDGELHLPRLDRPYDLVLGWDILDRMFPEAGARVVQWLANSTASGARVHVIVRASEDAIARPLRFTLVDIGRIRYEIAGTARLPLARLLPADVHKVLAPLQIQHAFTLKSGLREYLAVRP